MTKSLVSDMKFVFLFLHLLLLWTCCICLCSACKLLFFITFVILTKNVVSDMKFVFLFLHLLLLWTCAFTNAQEVSYFSLLHYLSLWTRSVVSDISLSPHATSVNLCIRLCSDGKLVFNTSYLLSFWQKVLLVAWIFFSFSTCYFCEHLLMFRR